MSTRLFVGNVAYSTTEQALRALFEEKGWVVTDVVIVTDRETGRSRGFGFVELDGSEDVERAKQSLDGAELEGRRLTIREAYERTPRRPERRFQKVEVERVGRTASNAQTDWQPAAEWPPAEDDQRDTKNLRGGRGRRPSAPRRGRRTRDDWHDEEGW